MTPFELRDEIEIELGARRGVVQELRALEIELGDSQPSVREKTAAAAFLAQFYNGIENILKRISLFEDVPLPEGADWHVELFLRFCFPSYAGLPVLFDLTLATLLAPYRRFRHVAFHSYGFQLNWNRMAEGIAGAPDVLERFDVSLSAYLDRIEG